MVFTILTLITSIYHITMHLNNFNNPFFQSKIIGIVFSLIKHKKCSYSNYGTILLRHFNGIIYVSSMLFILVRLGIISIFYPDQRFL
jgi:hypothetical protein